LPSSAGAAAAAKSRNGVMELIIGKGHKCPTGFIQPGVNIIPPNKLRKM